MKMNHSNQAKGKRLRQFALLLLPLLVVCCLCEVFLFNFRYFWVLGSHAPVVTVKADAIQLRSGARRVGSEVLLSGKEAEILVHPGVPLRNLTFSVPGCKRSFKVQIDYRDQNFSASSLSAGTWTVNPRMRKTQTLNLDTSGNCGELYLTFVKLPKKGITLRSIILNRPFFQFNWLRFLLLFFGLALCCAIFVFRPWELECGGAPCLRNSLFAAVLGLSLLISAATLVACTGPGFVQRSIPAGSRDNYQLLTQAFSHGQLSLMEKPSQALLQMQDPYDYSLRKALGVPYLFDTAFYKGKYYCYFGVAPVLTLMLPFRILTGVYMSDKLACLIFILAAMAAMALLYLQLVTWWFPRCSLLSFLSGEAAVLLGSNLLWLLSSTKYYEVAVLSCIAFLLGGFNFLVLACRAPKARAAALPLSGLCFGLMVASRPSSVFYLLLAAGLLFWLLRTIPGGSGRLRSIFLFLAPLGAVACGLMAYNYLRFGSIAEFGAKYQLTVSNINYMKFSNFPLLFYALWQYLFQPAKWIMEFPFFTAARENAPQVAQYYFNRATVGIFQFPVMLSLLACVPLVRHGKCPAPTKRYIVLTLLSSFLVMYLDSMLGGVCMRYSLDWFPMLTLCAVLLWLEAERRLRGRGKRALIQIFAGAAACTVLMSFNLCVFRSIGVYANHPAFYQYLYETFTFWI